MGTYVFDNGDGTLCAVDAESNEVIADTYNKDTFELTGTKSIPFELDKFGGVYSGKEYNFIVFGQSNPNEDNNVTTFKTVKYSKNWEKLGEADYKNNNTTTPFFAGSLRMTEYNGYLYVRSAHEMYTSSDGFNHQSNITYSVDINSMTIADQFSKVWNTGGGYVSHSFNQFIITDGSGNMISDVQTFDNAVLSAECQPLLVDGNILVWFTNTEQGRKFCVINTDGDDISENVKVPKGTF